MNHLSDGQESGKLSDLCDALFNYRIKNEYDMSFSLYDEKKESTVLCDHRTKGNVSVPLWQILALVGGCIAIGSIVHRTTSFLCK